MNQCDNPLGAANQQERPILTPDFLAGLITGEGSYYIGTRRAKGYITIYPAFGIRMNDLETMAEVARAFEFYELPYTRTTVYKKCAGLAAIGTKQLPPHLELFTPLLTGKKREAAEIVTEFTRSRMSHFNKRYTEYEIDLVEKLRSVNGPSRARVPIGILRDYTLRPHARTVGQDRVRSA